MLRDWLILRFSRGARIKIVGPPTPQRDPQRGFAPETPILAHSCSVVETVTLESLRGHKIM